VVIENRLETAGNFCFPEHTMGFEMINYEVKDAVASLILSRPARTNALNARMLEELELAMNLAEADERVRVVINWRGRRIFFRL
jgi:enoyl-CoA hydratase/carnithine racemase